MGKKESSKTRIKWSFPQGPVEEMGRLSAGNRGASAALGVATTTRVRGGLAAEMKALANNLQGVWGTTQWGPVLTSCAAQVTQHGTMHLLVWGNGEGIALAGTQHPLSGATGREEGEGGWGRSTARCSMHTGDTCHRTRGNGAPGCTGRCAPHPSIPLPGHHWGVGGCCQVPASPLPPTNSGKDAGPTSSAMVSIRASAGLCHQ